MRGAPRRTGRLAAAIVTALAAVVAAPPAAARADEWGHAGPERSSVRLHADVGPLLSDAGAGGALDAGLWIGPVLLTGGYRLVDTGARGRVAWTGGRAHLLLLELGPARFHAGAGAGSLRYQGSGESASVAALTLGGGVTFGDREGFNLVGLGVEAWAPLGRASFAAAPRPRAPAVMATLTLNLLYLYAMK